MGVNVKTKMNLNEPKKMFLLFLWLLPLIPQISIFILMLINGFFGLILLITTIMWTLLFGFIYFYFDAYLVIESNYIEIINLKKTYRINTDEIISIDKYSKFNNPISDEYYKLNLKNKNVLPSRFLIISNKKFKKYEEKIAIVVNYKIID